MLRLNYFKALWFFLFAELRTFSQAFYNSSTPQKLLILVPSSPTILDQLEIKFYFHIYGVDCLSALNTGNIITGRVNSSIIFHKITS